MSLEYLRNYKFVWPEEQSEISTPWKKKQRTSDEFIWKNMKGKRELNNKMWCKKSYKTKILKIIVMDSE